MSTPSASPSPEAASPLPGRRRRWPLGVGLTALVGLTIGLAAYFWPRPPAPLPLPAIDRAGLDPAVAWAVDTFEQKVRQEPASAAAWGRLGMVLLANDCFDESRGCFRAAERLDGSDPRWPYLEGLVLRWVDPAAAVQRVQRAAELAGDEQDAMQLRLAEMLLAQGCTREAEEHFRRIRSDQPTWPWAELGLARAALARGDPRAAQEHVQQPPVARIAPRSYHTLLAQVHERQGNATAARREQHWLDGELPGDQPAPDPVVEEMKQMQVSQKGRLEQARDLLERGRVAEAAGALEQLTRDYPDLNEGWLWLGRARLRLALRRQASLASAEQALRRAVQLAPHSADGHFYLGIVLAEQGQDAKAIPSFEAALRIKPDYGLAHYNLAQCLQKQRETKHAQAELEAAVRTKPQLTEARLQLARLLAAQGRKEEARAQLQMLLQLDPDSEPAQSLLEELAGKKTPPAASVSSPGPQRKSLP